MRNIYPLVISHTCGQWPIVYLENYDVPQQTVTNYQMVFSFLLVIFRAFPFHPQYSLIKTNYIPNDLANYIILYHYIFPMIL